MFCSFYIYMYLLLTFFSHIGHYRVWSRVDCDVQKGLSFLFYIYSQVGLLKETLLGCVLVLWSLSMLSPQPSDALSPVICSTLSSIQEPAPKDHKASRSSPLAPLKSHHLNVFELLSICMIIFKEAQQVHSITRSNHLSLWLKRVHPGSSVITHIMGGPVVKTLCFRRAQVRSLVGKLGFCVTQSGARKSKNPTGVLGKKNSPISQGNLSRNRHPVFSYQSH